MTCMRGLSASLLFTALFTVSIAMIMMIIDHSSRLAIGVLIAGGVIFNIGACIIVYDSVCVAEPTDAQINGIGDVETVYDEANI